MKRCKFAVYIIIFFQLTGVATAKETLFINDLKWPPFFFPNLERGNIGFGKEIMNYCLNQSQFSFKYKTLPIKRTHVYMQSGELDISVYSYKKERESFVFYGKEPIFISNYGFASKTGDNIEIKNLEDIKKYQFGHLDGLAHTKALMEIIKEKEKLNQVSKGYDIDSMFGQLLATPQRFQIMANSIETLLWRAKQLNIHKDIKVHDFILKQKPYFITISKTSKNIKNPKEFLTKIDSCIKKLKSSQDYLLLTKKYGLTPIKQ